LKPVKDFSVDRIGINQLMEEAETLDILLFKGKRCLSKCSQFMMRSNFGKLCGFLFAIIDHIALFLRSADGGLLLLEVT